MRRTALVVLLSVGFAIDGRLQADPVLPKLAVTAKFECLWWNEGQMNGMDPNNPPPKETRVELKRWEYSDPIGVPHPDVVDVAIKIQNESATAEDVVPDISIQWSEGAMSSKASAKWGKKIALSKQAPIHLMAGESKTITAPVDVKSEMDALAKHERWPWSLRVFAMAKVSGIVAGSSKAELPITPGD